jgi:hypothetical protein
MSNSVDPRQILQALLARRGGIMGMPQMPTSTPPFQGNSPGVVPGGQPPPSPQAQPRQAASQLPPAAPTPFSGTFGGRQGIISSIVNAAEKRSHDKKVNEAEMYYNQINSFLAAGDQESAHRLLDDPKIRKVLKTGLEYVPLEEEVPPEAIGVHKAAQKDQKRQQTMQQIQQMLQPRRAVIPGPSQEAQQKFQVGQQEIATKQAEAGKYSAEELRASEEASVVKEKADAEKLARQAEADRATAELKKAEKEMKESEELSPFKIQETKARVNQLKAQANELNARAKYFAMGGKLPGSQLQTQIKSSRSDLVSVFKDAVTDNNKIKDEMRKQSGVSKLGAKLGLSADVSSGSYLAEQRVQKLREAISWFDSEGTQAILDGKISVSDATKEAYKRAGMEAMPSGVGGPQPEVPSAPIIVSPEDMK